MKILISDKLASEGIEILKSVSQFSVDVNTGLKPEELKSIIKNYDAIIIRSATKLKADIIDAADNLKFIGRAGVGLDNVDLKAATKKGIVAMNTPAGNTTATAEQTMALILALSRNIPQACASLKAGKWERSKFSGVELYGKTLGVIGLGRIGSTVAKFAKSFGMNVIAYDPYLSVEMAAQKGVEMVVLEALLREADYITVHIPKSRETTDMISDKEFDKMKKSARVINCARGGIINQEALVRALEQNKIAGCAVDVFEEEPPPADCPLLKNDNCIATPHLGASTDEAQINVAIEIAETVRNALLGRGIMNAVNFPSVSAEAYTILEPYVDLAERMGKFAGQLINGRIKQIKVTYYGVVTSQKADSVTMALVNGLLGPVLGDMINSVNALEVAKERGIGIEVVMATQEVEFVNLISTEVVSDQEIFSVWGTLSANKKPRIVKINNVYVEAIPDGNMIFINNNDRPGIVGAVGTILAEDNINIAGITFGREKQGGRVVSVVNIDTEAMDATLERIRETKDVLFAKLIKV